MQMYVLKKEWLGRRDSLSFYMSPEEYGASLVVLLVKNLPIMLETGVQSLGWKDPLRRERKPTPVFWPGELVSRTRVLG